MKFDILKWAYESQFQPAVKGGPHSVLVALAYSANFKTEACFPSIKRLSFLTRLKPTAVKRGLAILKKEGLITVASGKGKRKTNHYAFNYNKIEKKTKTVNAVSDVTCQTSADRQTRTDCVLSSASYGSDCVCPLGQNPPTELSIENKEFFVSSSNLQRSFDDDEPASDLTYFDGREECTLLLGRGRQKPIGLAKASDLVDDWFEKRAVQRFGCQLNEGQRDDMAAIMSDAISIFTEPPKVGFNDIEQILSILKKPSDWDILEDMTVNVKLQACQQQIDNPRAYFMKALEDNVESGSASPF